MTTTSGGNGVADALRRTSERELPERAALGLGDDAALGVHLEPTEVEDIQRVAARIDAHINRT